MTCPDLPGIWKSCDFGPRAEPISLQPLIDLGIVVFLIVAVMSLAFFTILLVMILRD